MEIKINSAIDNIEITRKTPKISGTFEMGWADWYTDNNKGWEVGTARTEPQKCYSGAQCVATVLDGDYFNGIDSRLISPSIRLPELTTDEGIHLQFWHWVEYIESTDTGRIQISQFFDEVGEWSGWINISDVIGGKSSKWLSVDIDLSTYAGSKVRLAFYHDVDGSTNSSGWFIDDIVITGLGPKHNASISNVAGAWFDPALSGLGFNLVDTGKGVYVYYYGYYQQK